MEEKEEKGLWEGSALARGAVRIGRERKGRACAGSEKNSKANSRERLSDKSGPHSGPSRVPAEGSHSRACRDMNREWAVTNLPAARHSRTEQESKVLPAFTILSRGQPCPRAIKFHLVRVRKLTFLVTRAYTYTIGRTFQSVWWAIPGLGNTNTGCGDVPPLRRTP